MRLIFRDKAQIRIKPFPDSFFDVIHLAQGSNDRPPFLSASHYHGNASYEKTCDKKDYDYFCKDKAVC